MDILENISSLKKNLNWRKLILKAIVFKVMLFLMISVPITLVFMALLSGKRPVFHGKSNESLYYNNLNTTCGKIVVAADGKGLGSRVSSRFSKSRYFHIVDLMTDKVIVVKNPYAEKDRWAGISAARFISQKAEEGVVTGKIDWDAYKTLTNLDIHIYAGVQGRADNALDQYRAGQLQKTNVINISVPSVQGSQQAMWRGPGTGRMGGFGLGPVGHITCPQCGYTTPHQRGVPAYTVSCPRCGTRMVRRELLLQDNMNGGMAWNSIQQDTQTGVAPPIMEGQSMPVIIKEFGMEVIGASGGGVHVTGVMGNSHAQDAGLRAGDIIVALNGTRVTSVNNFKQLIGKATPESNVRIRVIRNGRAKSLSVMVGEGEMEGVTPVIK